MLLTNSEIKALSERATAATPDDKLALAAVAATGIGIVLSVNQVLVEIYNVADAPLRHLLAGCMSANTRFANDGSDILRITLGEALNG